jgi:hypothetical protein
MDRAIEALKGPSAEPGWDIYPIVLSSQAWSYGYQGVWCVMYFNGYQSVPT